MKNFILILTVIASLSSCKKEKQKQELINYTAAINVPNGVEFTVFTTGNDPEFFKIGTQRFNASGVILMSVEKGSSQEVRVITTGTDQTDVELIITKDLTKTVIYQQTLKKNITYNFTAE